MKIEIVARKARYFLRAIPAVLATAALTSCDFESIETAPVEAQVGEANVAALNAMWEGTWDNYQQTIMQELEGVPQEGWHDRRRKVFKRVNLPAFGDHVMYVEQYLGPDRATVYRQRIYVHSWDDEADEIVTDIYSFKEGEAKNYFGAHLDPSKLDGLKPADMDRIEDGCAVRWKRLGDSFLGYQYAETCEYIPPGTGLTEPVRLSDTITLSDEYLTTITIFRNRDGSMWFGNPLGVHQISRRADPFECSISRDGERREFTMLDEGGEARIRLGEAEYHVTLERLEYRLPTLGTDGLRLRLKPTDDEDRTLIDHMAAPDAAAIRANSSTEGVSVSCSKQETRS